MASEFYVATVPEPRHVLGLRLRPLSIGHIILLHRIESAYVCPEANQADAWTELAMAVAICSQTYSEALRTLEDQAGTAKAMAVWAARLTRNTWRDRVLGRKVQPIDITAQSQAFEAYIREHSKVPHYSYDANDVREVACPHVQMVKASLQRAFGFSDEVMMDRSWAVSLWDYVTLKALDGHIQMTDRSAIEEAQAVAEALAAKLAQRQGGANGTA
jgi:hypothetical protein